MYSLRCVVQTHIHSQVPTEQPQNKLQPQYCSLLNLNCNYQQKHQVISSHKNTSFQIYNMQRFHFDMPTIVRVVILKLEQSFMISPLDVTSVRYYANWDHVLNLSKVFYTMAAFLGLFYVILLFPI